MDWKKLLSPVRLRRPDAGPEDGRSVFQQDLDRIVFSSAFRRLAHKTQVHPLSPNDHVHTRLTHSIEVASVGRSLGTIVGERIAERLKDPSITADTFGHVVQAACLAHDIGNPPFGHSGEDAIQSWFRRCEREGRNFELDGVQREDFRHFEGNAQGFRNLTQLENNRGNGGLQLTYAVLGAFTKYPRSSLIRLTPGEEYAGAKKNGFFNAEQSYFVEVAQTLDLQRRKDGNDYWCRHPLAFLVESADDTCYAIIDIEDGYELKYLSFEEARSVLQPIAGNISFSNTSGPAERIGKLRAVAIDHLIRDAARVFLENENLILEGTFPHELLRQTKFSTQIDNAKDLAKKKLYWSDRKTELEIAGTEVIHGLLDIFSDVVISLADVNYDPLKLTGKAQRLARLMGTTLTPVNNNYHALLCVTDFVSGMTDRYAVDLYRSLKGISTR